MRRVAETFAKSAVENGLAIGASVGITLRGRPHFFAYGLADIPTGTPTTPDTIYQIGSVTKIFTTAMLGQNIVIGINQLSEPPARFTGELGALDPFTAAVTLEELGDFTAGLPSTPPCPRPPADPGLPAQRGARPSSSTRPRTSPPTCGA